MSSYVPLDNEGTAEPETHKGLLSKAQRDWMRRRGFGVLLGPPGPIVVSCVSGFINGMLMFSFAAVFASLIFSTYFEDFVPVGLNVFTGSALLTGVVGVIKSTFLVGVVGPDINPVLLFVDMSVTITRSIEDYKTNASALATMMFCIIVSTVVLGAVFWTLGVLKLTRFVQFVPATVLNGFLGSIGYKVLKEAVVACTGEYSHHPLTWGFWRLLLPALPIGVPLWWSKKKHIGNPLVVFPIFVAVPPAFFYILAFSLGYSLDDLRGAGWFYAAISPSRFWQQYTGFSLGDVNLSVFAQCVPSLLILIVICTLDYSLKMAGTKRAINTEINFDQEMVYSGVANSISGLLFCGPGYMQAKLAMLNYGIIHNNVDRLPALICAVFNGLLFFTGFPLLNYLPRFLLGGLLIFAGLPFIDTNLFESYHHMTKKEFLATWTIVILTALFGLLVGVVAGVGLAALIYSIQSGRKKVIAAVLTGNDYQSSVVRGIVQEIKLEHLGRSVVVIKLRHYVFFGSADQVFQLVKRLVQERSARAELDRMRYLIIDFEQADGIDFSAAAVLLDIVRYLKANSLQAVVFTGMGSKTHQRLRRERVLDFITASYETLDIGLEYVEEQLLEHSHKLRQRWFIFDALRKLHEQARLKDRFEALEQIFGVDTARVLRQYVERIDVHRNGKISEIGEMTQRMYLLQSGRMTSYVESADGHRTRVQSLRRGAFINEDSLMAALPAEYSSVADTDCTLLALSRDQYNALASAHPDVALDIQRVILTRGAILRNKLQRELYALASVQRDSLREARQTQLRSYRTQLRRQTTSEAAKVVDKQVQSLFEEFVAAENEAAFSSDAQPPNGQDAEPHFGVEGMMRVFADMQVRLTRAEAEELLFDADTADKGYITLESWYDTMTWIYETEEESATRRDEMIDASLFNIDAHETIPMGETDKGNDGGDDGGAAGAAAAPGAAGGSVSAPATTSTTSTSTAAAASSLPSATTTTTAAATATAASASVAMGGAALGNAEEDDLEDQEYEQLLAGARFGSTA